jgi:hypothetical protein
MDGSVTGRAVVPLPECGSAALSRFNLLVVVIFHLWNDALTGFVHHMLSPSQNDTTIMSIPRSLVLSL